MKFSCQTTDFLHGIQLVSRAISGQQALPILGNILFKVEGSTCTVSATDLELSMITSFPASIESEGAITIPSKAILNFAQYNTDPEIVLETVEGTHLKVTSKHSKTSLSGEAATSYPSIPAVEKKTSFKLDAAPLLEALNLVTFASARTSLRPVLSGVYLRTEGGKLILVATDSYRLSECSIPTEVAEDVGCIIPVKVLEELKGMLSSKKPPKATPTEEGEKQGERKEAIPVEITLSAQQIRQIIPKEHTTKALINTRELTAAVKRMHYFAKEVNNNLTFTLSGEEAHIHTPQTQLGKDETTISAEITGTEGKIAVSSSYLLDFLGHIDTEVLELRITDSMHPAVFYIPANDKFLHLIMPLRMQES
jgi:DNA polymerase-3 subunit beta